MLRKLRNSQSLTELDSLQDFVGLGFVIPSSQTREASRVEQAGHDSKLSLAGVSVLRY